MVPGAAAAAAAAGLRREIVDGNDDKVCLSEHCATPMERN